MDIIELYPNQKLIHKKFLFPPVEGEVVRSIKAEEQACHLLSYSELKLWLFLTSKNMETFPLSSKEISETYNLPTSSYRKAVNGLIRKGFLKRIGNSNEYEFNEEVK